MIAPALPASLTIALSKGRMLDQTRPLLEKAGIVLGDDVHKTRKLIIPTNLAHVRLLLVRASDVPTYVEYGAADIGVVGKDVLMEHYAQHNAQHGAQELYEPLDLKISRCRLMTAAAVGYQDVPGHRIRVATKFVHIAKRYFASQGRQVDIIKLYGSMELAPLVALADQIVDIVDTGNTLRANGLEPRESIADISARLVVNRAAMKVKHNQISGLIEQVRSAVAGFNSSANG